MAIERLSFPAASQPRKQPMPKLPLYVLAAVAALGGTLYFYLQYLTKHAPRDIPLTPEAKAYVRNLQLSDVEMQANQSYFNQVVVEIDGKITNTGDRAVDQIDLYCIFRDAYGQLVLRKRIPIVSPKSGGLKPGEMKTFRLPFDEIPESWNHAMPSLVIAGIKFS
ncbi:MAG TPA: hypothetical protein VKX39_10245 [Bryobacteraceae bacterium]|nr:hypothetical protein [Bryobacteraceae bacterium]